jgi:hypothetical protein
MYKAKSELLETVGRMKWCVCKGENGYLHTHLTTLSPTLLL